VSLVGHIVPPAVTSLSLKQRLILYCLLVEGITQEETIHITGCTEWDVDRSLRDGLRAVENYD
jgi:DNA-directed RNA polymerase specialized sigma subunit